jgi:pimeloyl-ACP methyl ester carboxylesterase
MGTGVAEYLAMHRSVAKLILCAPYVDVAAVLNSTDPKHSYVLAPDAIAVFNTTAMVKRIHAPLLILQGTRDDLIPPTQGPALEHVAASADKRFVPIVGAKHDGLLGNRQTLTAIHNFLGH